jgi:hypothetical protein
MLMNSLRISTVPALIGIQTTPGRMEIQQPKADVELNIEHPRVEIDSELGQVVIDQSQCFSESGLKNYSELTQDNIAYAKQKFSEAIARIVRQGDEMVMSLHKGTDMFAAHAMENALARNNSEFNMVTMPRSRPKIDFVGGTVEINVIEGRVSPDVRINKPIINFIRGNVDIYLRQRNSIHIEYIGNQMDLKA